MQEIFASEQIGFPVLSLLVFLPILGAIAVTMVSEDQQARKISLGVNIVLLLLSILVLGFFVRETSAFQFVERLNWIPSLGISSLLFSSRFLSCFTPGEPLPNMFAIIFSAF